MKRRKRCIRIFALLWSFSFCAAYGQTDQKWELGGYVKFLQTITTVSPDSSDMLTDNLVHNRLNISGYPAEHWEVHAGMRNRLFYGDFVEYIPGYAEQINRDNGFFDLTFNWFEEDAYFMNTTFDRLYVDYTFGKWQVKAGRQRINWGQNLVWNPNDVFNAFSYFDFDYEERPGTDAIRIQYYPGYTSTAELVYQLGSSLEESAFMGYYRFNKWQYDIQFIGGYAHEDAIAGLGWSGNIAGGGFRGEITYFSHAEYQDENGQVMASLSGDYTFPSSVYLHASLIYNSVGATKDIDFDYLTSQASLTAKTLTPSRMELFFQSTYQITPLINASAVILYNPYDASSYWAPSISISMMDNLELYLIMQGFAGSEDSEYGSYSNLYFWRMRWSF